MFITQFMVKKANNNAPGENVSSLYELGNKPFSRGAYIISMYIYLITNPHYEGWVKIGITKNLKARLFQYQTFSPFKDYSYQYRINVDDAVARKIEKYIIRIFYKKNKTEWLNCPVGYVVRKIEEKLNINNNDLIKNDLRKKSCSSGYYDYLTDGKVFNSIKELLKYIRCSTHTFSAVLFKNGNHQGVSCTINGYEIIRRKRSRKINKP